MTFGDLLAEIACASDEITFIKKQFASVCDSDLSKEDWETLATIVNESYKKIASCQIRLLKAYDKIKSLYSVGG